MSFIDYSEKNRISSNGMLHFSKGNWMNLQSLYLGHSIFIQISTKLETWDANISPEHPSTVLRGYHLVIILK
jgi:hypothetical protein